jgi:preprotein translocase subunit SecF
MMDFVGKKNLFFLISVILIVPGIISLIVFGLKPGVEYASGTSISMHFSKDVAQADLRQEFGKLGYTDAAVQRTSGGDYFVRLPEITADQKATILNTISTNLSVKIDAQSETVSPLIANETVRNTIIAVIVAAVAIMLYIILAFRKMPRALRWGTCAIIGLSHDIVLVVGIFSLLGWLAGVEVDSLFISGVLAILGFSINNIIIVFDRIRENVSRGISKDFGVTVNVSILETITRSLNTSLTALFTCVALFLFGGATIHNLVLVLLIGIAAGTYSSLCVSGQLLVRWETGK